MQDYTRLLVWQRARSLTVAVHEATRTISPRSAPGLRAQLLRAAMSIGATIAEGAGRDARPDFARVLTMAIGSASEVEHHLTTCTDLGLIEASIVTRLIDRCQEARKMLYGLRQAILEAEGEYDAKRSPDPN